MREHSLRHLHLMAKKRPKGYVEDVLAKASSITDTHYTMSDEAFETLKIKYLNYVAPIPIRTKPKPFDWTGIGPSMWAELHTKRDPSLAWLAKFSARIPCGNCKEDWYKLLAMHPPELGAGYFAWTVLMHNCVNVKRGVRIVLLAEARLLWNVLA